MACGNAETAQQQELAHTLCRLGLVAPEERIRLAALAGGISSEIFKVETPERVFVVKQALPRLRVAANWEAPVERNTYEVRWLETVAQILPDAAPRVLAKDSEKALFAMEYCDPALFRNWKQELIAGRIDIAVAAEVGRKLASIHSATADNPAIAADFSTDAIFHAIRLEPYLEATAARHPAVRNELFAISRRTLDTKRALVHGDISPKNILVGPHGPLFLDAECAWFGDPAFDVAFFLNHLLLKCLVHRPLAAQFLAAFDALAENYFARVDWESRSEIELRAGQLLPALFLARVDGKSPVEYLTRHSDRELVRQTALPLIVRAPASPTIVKDIWAAQLGV
jgi:aminoglycoside phosphotransferase (APT) family kinase protein